MENALPNNLKSSTKERVLAGAGIFTMGVGAFIVWYFNLANSTFFPACPFHAMTGLNCPGCGLTRGFNALAHGDILGALHYNLLLPVFAFFFGYLGLSLFLTAFRGYGLSWDIFSTRVVVIFLILTAVFVIVRNLPFYPFNLLAI